MKPKLKPPEAKRLKLNDDDPLSNLGFKFNLRRHISGGAKYHYYDNVRGRGLHSFTIQHNLSRFGHTSPCPPV
jgi:hypothetical protein